MFKNIPREKVLEIVRQGPTIPQKIVKQLGGDTMLIGAILSTMISTGDIRYTTFKVGGSPAYYVPADEAKLEEFINYLNEKDQNTVKMLKEQKVMQESAQDPLTRVSLRAVKDFARPFEIGKNKEIFYRYFLVSKEEAELLAAEIIKKQEQLAEEKIAEEKRELEESKRKEDERKKLEQEKKEREKKEQEKKQQDEEERAKKESVESGKYLEKTEAIIIPQADKGKSTHKPRKKIEHKTVHPRGKHAEIQDSKDFLEKIKEKVHDMGLDIISKEKLKKTEYNLILKNHDSNEYHYAVAKDKRSIDEGDLSTAFVFAHTKKMPCIFFMTGTLTKKAEEMTHKEFKEMTIITI